MKQSLERVKKLRVCRAGTGPRGWGGVGTFPMGALPLHRPLSSPKHSLMYSLLSSTNKEGYNRIRLWKERDGGGGVREVRASKDVTSKVQQN